MGHIRQFWEELREYVYSVQNEKVKKISHESKHQRKCLGLCGTNLKPEYHRKPGLAGTDWY